jgi:hypothetical protein
LVFLENFVRNRFLEKKRVFCDTPDNVLPEKVHFEKRRPTTNDPVIHIPNALCCDANVGQASGPQSPGALWGPLPTTSEHVPASTGQQPTYWPPADG